MIQTTRPSTPKHTACAALLVAASCCSHACAAPVELTLDVTVRAFDGTALADAPIEASTPHANSFALSDSSGVIHFVLDADDEDETIVVRLWGGRGYDLEYEDAKHAEERYNALSDAYAFSSGTEVPIVGAQTAYTVEIVGQASVSLTGSAHTGTGAPFVGTIGVVGRHPIAQVGQDDMGSFLLRGVPKDHDIDLFCMGDGYRLWIRHFPASLTSANASVGDIVVPDVVEDAPVDIEMTNRAGLYGHADTYLGGTLTLVRSDGENVYILSVNAIDKAAMFSLDTPEGMTPTIAAGTYFVSPGPIGAQLPCALLGAIRDGRQAGLEAAGVPKIDAVSGQTVSISFDARAARDAILSAASDLLPQP